MALQAHERQAQSSANCTSSRARAAVPGTADEGEDHRLPRFRVTAGRFGGVAGVMLSDAASGAYAAFALRGATLLDWRVPFAGAQLSLPLLMIGIPDRFIEHGSREDCLEMAGLAAPQLRQRITAWWSSQRATARSAAGR